MERGNPTHLCNSTVDIGENVWVLHGKNRANFKLIDGLGPLLVPRILPHLLDQTPEFSLLENLQRN